MRRGKNEYVTPVQNPEIPGPNPISKSMKNVLCN
jgi:hypothetical protein